MICPKCNTGTLIEGHATLPATVKEVAVFVFMNAYSCDSCDYKTVHGSQMAEYMRRAADEYRKGEGLLTSGQIRAARDGIGMNQEKFAEYLGVGIASVKRWELGQVQDRAMDNLLRLRTDIATAEASYRHLLERRNRINQAYSSGRGTWKRDSVAAPSVTSTDYRVA